MERLLERISVSRYRDNFILKGGMLVSSMIGIDQRSTMDVDATMTGQTLSPKNALKIVSEIAAIELDDDMTFEVGDSREIMKNSEYGGVQIPIRAYLGRMEIKLKIDISTGDAITPSKVAFQFPLMLEDRKIDIWAYNLETVLAEKAETVIVRGVLNTRMRDFYDIFMLTTVYDPIDAAIFRDAIRATAANRGHSEYLPRAGEAMSQIERSSDLSEQWQRYLVGNPFAVEAKWDDVVLSVRGLLSTGELI
ncbi:nucleotidyl transferase AbiEii/AbiGii toxin family protein [Raoultibacter massiliensis]|nr:nucleotidyl transferase AbiEii/AbiGii toxin family protein [Eggerthella lenta]